MIFIIIEKIGWLVVFNVPSTARSPLFTVPCEGREARFVHRESNPEPLRCSPLHYNCATPAPIKRVSIWVSIHTPLIIFYHSGLFVMYVWPVCDASQLDTVDVDGVLAVLSAASECDAQIRPRETLYLHQQRPRRILYRLCQKQVINTYNNGPVAFCTASVKNKS